MQKNLFLGQRIGIDKLELSNLTIEAIDFSRLRQTKAEISLFPKGSMAIREDDHGMPIKRIVIRDNHVFNDLIIGCAGDGTHYVHEYVYLTLTVAYARGDNVSNLSWDEYDYYLECACDYIADIYGISLNAKSSTIKSVELNCNIILSAPYQDYCRVLTLMVSWVPKTFWQGGSYTSQARQGQKSSDTFLKRNKQQEIIFYNKSEQIRKKEKSEHFLKHKMTNDLLRLELRILTPEKVKAAFGSNVWRQLNNQLIVDYFYECMSKWYIQKANQWEKQSIVLLKKMLRTTKNVTPKNWHHLLLHRLKNEEICTQIPIILDIKQVILAIRQLKEPSYTKSHMVKVIQRAKCFDNDVFWKNDLDKLYEILDGIKAAYEVAQLYAGVDTSNIL